MIKLLTLLLGLLFIGATQVQAIDAQPSPAADLPIEVTAQQLEALQQLGQAIFTGEVVAKQGDITIYCDRMVVFTKAGQRQVDRLEAFGGVRVVQLDRIATAAKAIYRQQLGTLVLTGDAKIHQGANEVAGDEITLFLLENRSIVKSGDSGRVRAVIFPEQLRENP